MIPQINLLEKAINHQEEIREKVIIGSRKVIQLSKLVIFGLHRDEKVNSKVHEMTNEMRALRKFVGKDLKQKYSGSYKVAEQEYVEAMCYYYFKNKSGKIPSCKELDCDPEYYLLGICDFSSELVRTATQFAIDGNIPAVEVIKAFIEEIHGELLNLDLRGELRKNSDAVRWSLNKLTDLVSQAKLSGK